MMDFATPPVREWKTVELQIAEMASSKRDTLNSPISNFSFPQCVMEEEICLSNRN